MFGVGSDVGREEGGGRCRASATGESHGHVGNVEEALDAGDRVGREETVDVGPQRGVAPVDAIQVCGAFGRVFTEDGGERATDASPMRVGVNTVPGTHPATATTPGGPDDGQ